ncbi:Rab28, ras superfamily GTPase [Tribonema minus]|uniref:Rab28, ras superfamily GTPase n=1 Tax=Tribonema minus TaxID=303371 RepID=A0A835YXE0_9STRA|nr:Rab28, ras superfamily GTPase [Tribonema minus]
MSNQAEHESDDEPEQQQFKIILLGDGAVGKTSIANRFAKESFSQSYKQTIGLDFFIKRIVLPGDISVALQLWDIGGQSIGSKMLGNYIHGSHAVIFCYDVTNADSFLDLEDWRSLVMKSAADDKPVMALAGNKCDLSHIRAVRSEAINTFADKHDMQVYFMSAKSGDQVNACFHRLAAQLAEVSLSKADLQRLDGAENVVTAEIVNHPRHDPNVNKGEVPEFTKTGRSCSVS